MSITLDDGIVVVMKYLVLFAQGPTSVGASVPDLPGCIAVGKTRAEAERLIAEAMALHVAALREMGGVPEPVTEAAFIELST